MSSYSCIYVSSCYYVCVRMLIRGSNLFFSSFFPLFRFGEQAACPLTSSSLTTAGRTLATPPSRRSYALYLLYWYKSTNTDAARARASQLRPPADAKRPPLLSAISFFSSFFSEKRNFVSSLCGRALLWALTGYYERVVSTAPHDSWHIKVSLDRALIGS